MKTWSTLRTAGFVSVCLVGVACGTSLVVGDDSGVSSDDAGNRDAATVLPPQPDGATGDSARPETDAGAADANTDGPEADGGACVLVRSGNVIAGCKVSSISLQVNLSKVKDGGATCSSPSLCCETSLHEVDASAPIALSFDLDTGVLTWNGRLFETLTKQPSSGDGGPLVYNVLPPKNTVETIDVGRAILLAADASTVGYDGFFPQWLTARSGGGGGVAGETVQSTGVWTRAELEPDGRVLHVMSLRLPTLTTGTGCNPTARIAIRADMGVVLTPDAGRD